MRILFVALEYGSLKSLGAAAAMPLPVSVGSGSKKWELLAIRKLLTYNEITMWKYGDLTTVRTREDVVMKLHKRFWVSLLAVAAALLCVVADSFI